MYSVIIPLYNKAAYVQKAISSVLKQTYREFELIVVDDGSKDEGWEIVQELFSSLTPPSGGWTAITQKNSGVSSARNNGVKLAKYDYVAFLDADDWWEPTYLEEMNRLINEFPGAGIYGSSYYKVRNRKLIVPDIGVEKDFEKGYIDYFKVYATTMWMPLWTGAVVVPKCIFTELNGFKTELKLGEDFHLWVRIANQYKVVFLNKQLSYYNQDADALNRAVEQNLYLPTEHMLFADYEFVANNADFMRLFEVLAVYGLLPYYLAKKNKPEVDKILSSIHWQKHAFKYRLFYRILPHSFTKLHFKILKSASKLKSRVLKS